MISVDKKVITNQSNCIVLQKVISFVYSLSLIFLFESIRVGTLEIIENHFLKLKSNLGFFRVVPSTPKTNQLNKDFGVQEFCAELSGTVDVWITVRFPTFFLER